MNGELEGVELQKIKQQMDADFVKQVAQHREVEAMLTGLEIDDWKQRVKVLLKEKKAGELAFNYLIIKFLK